MLVHMLRAIVLPFGYLFFPALPFAAVYFGLQFLDNRRGGNYTAKRWGLLMAATLTLLIVGLVHFTRQAYLTV